MARQRRGFTLVELLVVIGIIAVLIGILLPALSRARDSANTTKCASNLRNIGHGMDMYLADNKGTFPAAYTYNYMHIQGGVESPPSAIWGYVHWSSYLYSTGLANSNQAVFGATRGWDIFRCPVLDNGGLPPCNTFAGNLDAGQSVDNKPTTPPPNSDKPWLGNDYQAPRLSYTVNEALCPRNKFVLGFQNCTVTYHYVRAASVKHSAQVILATEFNNDWHMVQAAGENDPSILVCKSHRPISGFIDQSPANSAQQWDLSQPTPPFPGSRLKMFRRVTENDLAPNPTFTSDPSPNTTLDWVGRNHGNMGVDSTGWNINNSNFLYVDGHVETKHVRTTIGSGPSWEWGDFVYSVQGGTSVSGY